jgi:hypothetical protein
MFFEDWKVVVLSVISSIQFCYIVRKFIHFPKTEGANVPIKGDEKIPVKLFVFGGSMVSVSSSPFSSKVVTYCRLNNIPHTIHESDPSRAPNGKTPYVVHGKNIFGDSQFIIRYLENTFDTDKSSLIAKNKYNLSNSYIRYNNLSKKDQAISELLRITCETQLYYGLISKIWGGKYGISKTESNWKGTVKSYFVAIPSFLQPILCPLIRASMYYTCVLYILLFILLFTLFLLILYF